MYKIYLTALLLLVIFFQSCKKDDSFQEFIASDPQEEAILNENTVSDNLVIIESSRISEPLPEPRGTIDFPEIATSQYAYLKHGFTILLPTGDYSGAYIQVKSLTGNLAPNYHDVPITNRSNVNSSSIKSSLFTTTNIDGPNIPVHFKRTMTPGKFCFLISVYDNEGNVSQPQEVCINIEAWGGNPNLVSHWKFDHVLDNGLTVLAGEDHSCSKDNSYTCNNQETLEILQASCEATSTLNFTIREDGTYSLTEIYKKTKKLNIEDSTLNCEARFDEDSDDIAFRSHGKWAFDEENGTLTLVQFAKNDPFELDYGKIISTNAIDVTATSLSINENQQEEAGVITIPAITYNLIR
ncbi:hypothetical protein [Aquimarina rhabdastrellae]